MITQETFNKLELEHGCGYWNMCWEHACPCAITVENKGLQKSICDNMCEENRQIAKQSDIDDYNNDYEEDYEGYECPFCGHIIETDSMCGCT